CAVRRCVPLNTMCSRRCDTPMRSRGSWSDAARTHAAKATDRTPGMNSESTVRPFGRTVRRNTVSAATSATSLTYARSRPPRPPPLRRGLPPRSPRSPRPSELSRRGRSLPPSPPPLVAVDELHLHAIALLDHVLGLLSALVAHLRDVNESFGSGHDLDECAEGGRRLDRAFVCLAD